VSLDRIELHDEQLQVVLEVEVVDEYVLYCITGLLHDLLPLQYLDEQVVHDEPRLPVLLMDDSELVDELLLSPTEQIEVIKWGTIEVVVQVEQELMDIT